jgi:hypothetical protein
MRTQVGDNDRNQEAVRGILLPTNGRAEEAILQLKKKGHGMAAFRAGGPSGRTNIGINLVTGVIGMPSQNSQRTVHLLSKNDPSKLMGQRDAAKRKKKIGALPCAE